MKTIDLKLAECVDGGCTLFSICRGLSRWKVEEHGFQWQILLNQLQRKQSRIVCGVCHFWSKEEA